MNDQTEIAASDPMSAEVNKLECAIALAVEKHYGQRDKAGLLPYILHPLRVMLSLAADGEAAMITGVLHDIVEDTNVSLEQLRTVFGDEVAGAVDSVSHRAGESYRDFIARANCHPLGKMVKLADLRDNLIPERLRAAFPGEAKRQQVEEKYTRALLQLLRDAPIGPETALIVEMERTPTPASEPISAESAGDVQQWGVGPNGLMRPKKDGGWVEHFVYARDTAELRQQLAAKDAEIENLKSARKHTQEWFTRHYGKLQDWARKRLPENWKYEFFNCIANGLWSATEDNGEPYTSVSGHYIVPNNYFTMGAQEQMLYDQMERAESVEASLAALKASIPEKARQAAGKISAELFDSSGWELVDGPGTFAERAAAILTRIFGESHG